MNLATSEGVQITLTAEMTLGRSPSRDGFWKKPRQRRTAYEFLDVKAQPPDCRGGAGTGQLAPLASMVTQKAVSAAERERERETVAILAQVSCRASPIGTGAPSAGPC